MLSCSHLHGHIWPRYSCTDSKITIIDTIILYSKIKSSARTCCSAAFIWMFTLNDFIHIPKSYNHPFSVLNAAKFSLRKQPTFREVATWALAKQRQSNERRNSILITYTTQILVVLLIGWKKIPSRHNQSEALPRSGSAHHQYGISALVTQTSFCQGSSGDLAKRRLFSQAMQSTTYQLSFEMVTLHGWVA